MELSSFPIIGIALAVLSAALLTVGNHLQSVGVERASGGSSTGLGASGFWALARTPVWLLGSVLFGLAILAQLTALAFAPLIVVQPVGVIALVFASALTAVVTRRRPSGAEIVAILVAVASLAAFVGVAAAVSVQTTITDRELILILIILLVVLAVTFAVLALLRRRGIPPVVYVVLGGLFAGFVATLGKTVILRVQTAWASQDFSVDDTNLLTIACLVGIAVAGALSIYFVQTAHTVNTPQTVVAGLTIVDPFIAVILGITVLGEAVGAPLWSFGVFAVAGAGAMWAVWRLASITQPAR
ncbi:multidrug DMT transporter permease [Microbacterium sp. bgisy207]|jgi:hypothetical protein|uniref:multidrug DMT transporter permease n=1 Tax=Microbacterium sp. bgisy207 TaxID=3413800 RepID=UPI003EBD2787